MELPAPYAEYLAVCEKAIRAGGAAIQNWIGKFEVEKKGPADLVTQADLDSQRAICRTIWEIHPDHRILGEEDSRLAAENAAPSGDSGFRWITDPLDGTTNFVHGIPHYAVSLALEHEGRLLVGGVWNPVQNEFYLASAGGGAWLNGRPLRTSAVAELSEAVGAFGLPPQIDDRSPDLRVFLKALYRCQGLRRSGSAALNLCYLAAGRYDLFWSFSTKIWDVAAGILLVREAGGSICTPDGGDYSLPANGPLLAAANPPLLAQLQTLTTEALQIPKK
jgi:myo-inositol-1(or 4)-monophosphatase